MHTVLIVPKTPKDWKTLARLAAVEQDPQKLFEIVRELNAALDEQEQRLDGKLQARRVLVVDDDPNVRLTLVPILEQAQFEVIFAGTMAEAIRAIETNDLNVLICDLNVSEPNDGFTAVMAMKKAHPRSVTILLTGYPAFDSAIEGIRQAVDDYVVKPVDYEALIQLLEAKLAAKFHSGVDAGWP